MKTLMAFAAALALMMLAAQTLQAADAARGDLLEIHSCQVYIGGCIASSEATQDGRYRLRVWGFPSGAFGSLLAALLELSDQNLAEKGTAPSEAVAYLPAYATSAQAAALLDWLKATNPQLAHTRMHVRTVPMSLSHERGRVEFAAGDFAAFTVKPLQSCGLTSCGESLWYTPRSAMTGYTVEVAEKVAVHEPLLALRWIDHDKNSVFQGRFAAHE